MVFFILRENQKELVDYEIYFSRHFEQRWHFFQSEGTAWKFFRLLLLVFILQIKFKYSLKKLTLAHPIMRWSQHEKVKMLPANWKNLMVRTCSSLGMKNNKAYSFSKQTLVVTLFRRHEWLVSLCSDCIAVRISLGTAIRVKEVQKSGRFFWRFSHSSLEHVLIEKKIPNTFDNKFM